VGDTDPSHPGSGSFIITSSANAITVKGWVELRPRSIWNNTGNADVSVAGDWTNNGVTTFAPGTGTITFNGTGSQTIGGSASTTFYNLTINNTSADTAGVSLGINETVNNTLTLTDGLLKVGAYNLNIGTGGSISGGSATSMVVTDTDGSASGDGYLCKLYSGTGSFTFPVGDASGTTEYSRATLNFTSGTFSSGQACVRVTDALHPDDPSVTSKLSRYWTVTSSGITSFSCGVTFYYVTADVTGMEANLKGARYTGDGWYLMNAVNTGSHYFDGTVSEFSDFTAIDAIPTASTVSELSASAMGDAILLTWQTFNEMDILGFKLYRATEPNALPEEWEQIYQAKAKYPGQLRGDSYEFSDANVQTGMVYFYWLEVLHKDGSITTLDPASTSLPTATKLYLPIIIRR